MSKDNIPDLPKMYGKKNFNFEVFFDTIFNGIINGSSDKEVAYSLRKSRTYGAEAETVNNCMKAAEAVALYDSIASIKPSIISTLSKRFEGDARNYLLKHPEIKKRIEGRKTDISNVAKKQPISQFSMFEESCEKTGNYIDQVIAEAWSLFKIDTRITHIHIDKGSVDIYRGGDFYDSQMPIQTE